MVVRMSFSHSGFSRIVECDTIEQTIAEGKFELITLVDGKANNRFNFTLTTEDKKNYSVNLVYLEKGVVVDEFKLNCLKV